MSTVFTFASKKHFEYKTFSAICQQLRHTPDATSDAWLGHHKGKATATAIREARYTSVRTPHEHSMTDELSAAERKEGNAEVAAIITPRPFGQGAHLKAACPTCDSYIKFVSHSLFSAEELAEMCVESSVEVNRVS